MSSERSARQPLPGQAADVWPPDRRPGDPGPRWQLRRDDGGREALVDLDHVERYRRRGPRRVPRAAWAAVGLLAVVFVGIPAALMVMAGAFDGAASTERSWTPVAVLAVPVAVLLTSLLLGMYGRASGWAVVDADGIHRVRGARRLRTLAWSDIDEITVVDTWQRRRVRALDVHLRHRPVPRRISWTTPSAQPRPPAGQEMAEVASVWWARGWVPDHVGYREDIGSLLAERGEPRDGARAPHRGRPRPTAI